MPTTTGQPTIIACVATEGEGSSLMCADCCYHDDPEWCEGTHTGIFNYAEVQCTPPVCDECNTPIDGYRIIHHFLHDVCEHCDIYDPERVEWHWAGYGPPSYPAINVKHYSTREADRTMQAFEEMLERLHPNRTHREIDADLNLVWNGAFESAQEQWWDDAQVLTDDIEGMEGVEIESAGRSGGWLIIVHKNGRRREPWMDRDTIDRMASGRTGDGPRGYLSAQDYLDNTELLRAYAQYRHLILNSLEGVDETLTHYIDMTIEDFYQPAPQGDAGGTEWVLDPPTESTE